MGRPKGSKNKPKVTDSVARIAEIDRELEGYAGRIVDIEQKIAQTTRTLTEQKSELRAANRMVKALEKEKDKLKEAADKQEREREARQLIDSFLASGKSIDDLKMLLS